MEREPTGLETGGTVVPRTGLWRWYLVILYWASWAFFAAGAVCFSVVICLPFLVFVRWEKMQKVARLVISRLMGVWVRWLNVTRVATVCFEGFEETSEAGTVYVANHPSLLDATFLLAQLPRAVCILKPSLLRNLATGPAASLAGYVSSDGGVDLFRRVHDLLEGGCSLLIFPEGSRTEPGSVLSSLRPGFAMIANRVGAPVQTILVHTSRDLVRRGGVWWRPPEDLPAKIRIVMGRRWERSAGLTSAQLAEEVESYLRTELAETVV